MNKEREIVTGYYHLALTDTMTAGWIQHSARFASAKEASPGVHTFCPFTNTKYQTFIDIYKMNREND